MEVIHTKGTIIRLRVETKKKKKKKKRDVSDKDECESYVNTHVFCVDAKDLILLNLISLSTIKQSE